MLEAEVIGDAGQGGRICHEACRGERSAGASISANEFLGKVQGLRGRTSIAGGPDGPAATQCFNDEINNGFDVTEPVTNLSGCDERCVDAGTEEVGLECHMEAIIADRAEQLVGHWEEEVLGGAGLVNPRLIAESIVLEGWRSTLDQRSLEALKSMDWGYASGGTRRLCWCYTRLLAEGN